MDSKIVQLPTFSDKIQYETNANNLSASAELIFGIKQVLKQGLEFPEQHFSIISGFNGYDFSDVSDQYQKLFTEKIENKGSDLTTEIERAVYITLKQLENKKNVFRNTAAKLQRGLVKAFLLNIQYGIKAEKYLYYDQIYQCIKHGKKIILHVPTDIDNIHKARKLLIKNITKDVNMLVKQTPKSLPAFIALDVSSGGTPLGGETAIGSGNILGSGVVE